MAAKKTAGKTTTLAKWDEKFASYAKDAKAQVANVGNNFLSIKLGPGRIDVGGTSVPGARLETIVVGSCALNAWNKDKYDSENPQPPDCYAFAQIVGDPDQTPHEKAPLKQAKTCAVCPKNEFGSADTGKGKACANTVRLGVLVAKDVEDGESATAAELATVKISPTNLKAWAGYVKALLDDHGRPPWAVVTEISSHSDAKTQIRVEFKMVSLIEDQDILSALEARYLKVQDALQQPFSVAADRPTPVKAGASKKFAAGGAKKR